jgi:hypothetical protein
MSWGGGDATLGNTTAPLARRVRASVFKAIVMRQSFF